MCSRLICSEIGAQYCAILGAYDVTPCITFSPDWPYVTMTTYLSKHCFHGNDGR